MRSFSREDIDALEKRFRSNLINSSTGFKPANLIATVSDDGVENVAVFSSIVHLGAHPPLYGFILRPTTVPRHTYANIRQMGYYTLNAFTSTMVKDAHHTSAKYEESESEFDFTGLEAEYKNGFFAPYVKECPLQIGMKYMNEYPIEENDTILVVGTIVQLHVDENMLCDDGFVDLGKNAVVAINGLDGYATPTMLQREAYARPMTNK
ncbi:flavin reductase family protein [Sungkyunkwania multivorans]|uniref:Flavin reductase family protein n=1 Tax=Sungkyunkwania multivorans TaxID=1173618 RepID=A0ABW3CVV4_9FLAO